MLQDAREQAALLRKSKQLLQGVEAAPATASTTDLLGVDGLHSLKEQSKSTRKEQSKLPMQKFATTPATMQRCATVVNMKM